MEALLKLDNAGLEVNRTGIEMMDGLWMWTATIRIPHDLNTQDIILREHHHLFVHDGDTRQEAVVGVWQKYQEFMKTERGQQALISANGQLMFRI